MLSLTEHNLSLLVNPEVNIFVEHIGKSNNRIIIVDDILQNPDEFHDFICKLPIPLAQDGFPGYQLRINYDFPQLESLLLSLAKQHYGIDEREFRFNVNRFDGHHTQRRRCTYPHVDVDSSLAANIYLTKEIEGKSGTAFYKHKRSGLEYRPIFKAKYRYDSFEAVTTQDPEEFVPYIPVVDNSDFLMYNFIEGKYNRLVMYEADLFHNLFVEEGTYMNQTRDSLAVFL
tara:strand:- start:405 stop:1091 length:687 start_codon:yes stop_codon:yes gene_type:complete